MESDIGIINCIYNMKKNKLEVFKMEKMDSKNLLLVSLMIFSMFFLVQEFNISTSIRTIIRNKYDGINGRFFLISAVGLPILAIAVVAKSGGLHILASRVHPKFAFAFTVLIYLSIGPFLGIPRAAS